MLCKVPIQPHVTWHAVQHELWCPELTMHTLFRKGEPG